MKLNHIHINSIYLTIICFVHIDIINSQPLDTAGIIAQADILNRRTTYFMRHQQIDSAKFYIDSTLNLISTNLGEIQYHYAIALNALGNYYNNITREYNAAVECYRRALLIGSLTMKPDDINYIGMKINLGTALYYISEYEEAEYSFLSAKDLLLCMNDSIREPNYSRCLTELICLYDGVGRFEEALRYSKEHTGIVELQKGIYSYEYGTALGYQAVLKTKIGDYNDAEKLHIRTLKLMEENGVPDTLDYAGKVINFAVFYNYTGRQEQAEKLLLQAKDIFELRLRDTLHPWYANCIYNLALVYQAMGLYDKSLPFVKKVNILDENEFGPQSPTYASGLGLLSEYFLFKNQLDSAELILRKAMEINQNALGYMNQETAVSVIKIANVYEKRNQFKDALAEYRNYLNIISSTLGKDHPKYLTGLLSYMNCLYNANPSDPKMDSLIIACAELNRKLMFQATKFMTENELIQYVKQRESHTNLFLPWGLNNMTTTAGSAYDDALLFKGLLVNNISNVKYKFGVDSNNLLKLEQLKSYHWRMAAIHALPIELRDSVTMLDLADKANTLEKELTRSVDALGESIKEIHWLDVKSKLKTTEAAIEIVDFKKITEAGTDTVLYGALVLHPLEERPVFIPLFNETDLNVLRRPSGYSRAESISDLYQGSNPTLYNLIWQPLLPYLHDSKTVYYSPSGLLYRINLPAIPMDETTILSDQYELIQLGSTRELVYSQSLNSNNIDCALYGGITYEVDTTYVSSEEEFSSVLEHVDNPEVPFSNTNFTLRGGTWSNLNGSDKEVQFILPILQNAYVTTTAFREDNATEESFKALSRSERRLYSPRIIHLSTHGYFFPDPQEDPTSVVFTDQEPIFKISDHPMIRSGLILAGGNYAWKHAHPYKPGMEDGILTAYEISQMDLSNTELVVLSACETGLGDIQGNEGVYGLQRAFKIAGVKNLIMSLWKVPDAATAELMISFYKHWLEDKMTIRQALHTAQKELRDEGFEPYYWAGWVLVE